MQIPRPFMQKAPPFRSSAAFSPCNLRWVHAAEQQQHPRAPTLCHWVEITALAGNSSLPQSISKNPGLPVEFRDPGGATAAPRVTPPNNSFKPKTNRCAIVFGLIQALGR